jgi:hypothetical protein
MNDRLTVATQILNGICAGDWKFEITTANDWDQKAVDRAVYLADKLIAASETPIKPDKKKKVTELKIV